MKIFNIFLNSSKRNKTIFFLVLLEISLLLVAGISYGHKTLDKYVFGSNDLKNTNLFAIMIDDENGGYKESTSDTFPGYEYFYNQSKSNCMDMTGKPIEDSLLYNQDTKTASITVSDTSSCYLYFDNWKSGSSLSKDLIASGNLWQSGLEGDGYRYTGTNPNNYICFGTADKSTCTTNQDKYMYRIIGVFEDASGNNHVKLIKYKQLASLAWNSASADVNWENSTLYSSLNGSEFLTNTTYDYLQNTTWKSKIENWTWTAVNTLTNDKSGPDYNDKLSPSQIYLHEMNRSGKSSSVGSWTTPTGKIGIMYASDYTLSLGASALALTTGTNTNATLLKTGWMHQSNNDTTKSTLEWTMARSGLNSLYFDNYQVYILMAAGSLNFGTPNQPVITLKYGIRPVLYLTANTSTSSGTGTLDNPFIVSSDEIQYPKVNLSLSNSNVSITITKGTGNLNKYCINNKASINDCEWKSVISTNFNHTLPSEGTYYVHVIDDMGYIARESIVYEKPQLNKILIDSNKMWQSGLEGDGYRFTGTGAYTTSTTPSNFVCFGTTDKSTCKSNPDTYMYRVIGVFDDQVKLIKLSSLASNAPFTSGTRFSQGIYNFAGNVLAERLNGVTPSTSMTNLFIGNSSYSYLNDSSGWVDLISEKGKREVVTLGNSGGPDYYYSNQFTPRTIYLHEMNRDSKTSTVGRWYDNTYKISVMNVSDYLLSLGSTSLSMTSGTYLNRNTLKTSWLFLGNNKYGNTSGNYTTEHTSASYGPANSSGTTNYSWTITSTGYLYYTSILNEYAIRPVFFLNTNVTSSSGTGTLSDPYMIDN